MKNRIVALLLAVLMAASIMTACGSNGSNSESTTTAASGESTTAASTTAPEAVKKDPITFTMFNGTPGQAPAPDAAIVKKIQELTGVTIEFEFLVGDLAQKSGTMIASGDYPDIINPGNDRNKFIEAGAFAALDDKLYNYPNLKKHFEPYDAKLRAIAPDKKIYILDVWGRRYGEIFEPSYGGPAFWIQKAVLAEFGYKKPTTLDEYFKLIEDYKAKYPTIDGQPTIGFEVLSDGWRSFCLKNPAQHLIGHPNDGDIVVKQDTLKSEIYANKDYAKTYYQKLNEEYLKGMISAETFTQTYDQYLARLSAGRVLGMFDQGWNFQDGVNLLIRDKKFERTYVPLELTYEGVKPWYRERPVFVGGNGTGISVKCKDVDRALAFMDQLLDEDIQKLLGWGIEGVDYLVDQNGKYYRTQEMRDAQADPTYAVKTGLLSQLWGSFPKIEGFYSDGNGASAGSQPEEVLAGMQEYDRNFLTKYNFKAFSEFMTVGPESPAYYPVWAFTIPDGTPAKVAYTKYTDTEVKYLPRVIMSKSGEFDKGWTNYVAELEKTNYKEYEAEVDKQVAERMANAKK
jgi:putative aldouronate transport system substrate-binding protein